MNIARTDEHHQFAASLQKLLQAENDFEQLRQRLRGPQPNRLALWPGLAELGVLGAAFDEASGGFAGDARTVAVAMMELGRSLAVEPFLACAVVAGHVLASQSDTAAARATIDELIAGTRVAVLAHDAGVDPFSTPLTLAQPRNDAFILNGTIRCVRHADVAGEFLLTATLSDAVAIFRVPAELLEIQPYRLMDGAGAADLHAHDLALPAAALLKFPRPAGNVLAEALERALLGLAAETAGIVAAVNAATFRYLTERRQFGAPLATFQALQHRVANMETAARELEAMLDLAIDTASGERGLRLSVLSALKCVADRVGRTIGHEGVQLHGGMGVSDELIISHYARRLATLRAQLGTAAVHRQRFGINTALGDLLALQDSPDDRAWREQVKVFTQAHLPERIAVKGRLGMKIDKEDYVDWQKILRAHGLFAAAWPKEYGGADWDLIKQLLFVQESALCNAPMISPYGVNMVGPVIYTFGSDEQKRRHLPGILSSEVWWCQGYSEPGAGSDLASLRTFAERDADHYIVNGSKLWTTEAHWADWMHCLVRTATTGKPQAGITFLLIDMKSPGISIRPIVTIDGIHHTNAVFFDNVRVPVANRVGEENAGWSIAKFLLSNERVSIADTGPKLHLFERIRRLCREAQMPESLRTLANDRCADLGIQLITLCTMERQCVQAWSAGKPSGIEASMLKIRGTEILQALCELALELEGPLAAAHDPEDSHRPPREPLTPAQRGSLMGREYLYSRCWSIFGGTNEIQRNIIAKEILAAR